MRGPLVLALLLALGAASGAQVVRCRDAAGRVSYNDTGCKAGDQRVDLGLDPGAYAERGEAGAAGSDRLQQQLDGVERARRLQRETVDAVTRSERAAVGVANARLQQEQQEQQAQQNRRDAELRRQREAEAARWNPGWSPQVGGAYGVPYGAPYAIPYGAVPYRGPAPALPDMRPQLRDCGIAGCQDTQGNHYDRAGRLDRYVRPDGRTCRPVGTTVVCN
jgi:hypothetical protein